ncbi:hypothetical protein Tco_0274026 [Tanacetum coccineum]
MLTTRQGMSFARIEHIVNQQIANAIKAIAVYKAKIRMDHDSTDQVVRHYKSDCPKLNRVNQTWKLKASGNSNVVKDNADA